MTILDDLSPEAKHLLRAAKGGDDATSDDVDASISRYRQGRSAPTSLKSESLIYHNPRRVMPWALVAAAFTATVGAYATVGSSLGLPLPEWWPELTAWSGDTTSAERSEGNPSSNPNPPKSTPPRDNAFAPAVAHTVREEPAPLGDATATPPVEQRAPRTTSLASTTPALIQPRTTTAPVEPSSESALTREVQMLTAARDALNTNDCATALRHLSVHRLAFPKGVLSEERQALTVICECRTGAGKASAQTFVAQRAESPLTRRVARECDLSPRP